MSFLVFSSQGRIGNAWRVEEGARIYVSNGLKLRNR